MASPLLYRQNETLPNGNTTLAVTLDTAFSDANYTVIVEPPFQTSFWITNKTSSGFTLNTGTSAPGYTDVFNFILRWPNA